MFDIGWGELLLVGMIALIVIGPKELPTVMRTLGHWMGRVKRMASEFQGQFQEALREAELDDLKKQAEDLTGSVGDMSNPLADVQKDVERALDTSDLDKLPASSTESESDVAALADTPGPASNESGSDVAALADTPEPAAKIESESAAPLAGDEDELAPAEPRPKQAGGSA
jgi:sec-independent protein translocase protein TatB